MTEEKKTTDLGRRVETALREILKEIPILKTLVSISERLADEAGRKNDRAQVDRVARTVSDLLRTSSRIEEGQAALLAWFEHIESLAKEIPIDVLSGATGMGSGDLVRISQLGRIVSLSAQLGDAPSPLGNEQLMFDTSEKYAALVAREDANQIIERLPLVVSRPVLLHNLVDILVEAQGHFGVLDGMKPEVLRALRLAEKAGLHMPSGLSLFLYELLGALGLLIGELSFYRKYLDLLALHNLTGRPEIFRRSTWWADTYYGSRETAAREHEAVLRTHGYDEARVHAGLLLAMLRSVSLREILDEAGVVPDSELLRDLDKLKMPGG